MNPSLVVPTAGHGQTQGKVSTALSSSNVQDSSAILVKLEAKYGQKKNLRLDSAQTATPKAHVRAEKFRQYTEWLTMHLDAAQSVRADKINKAAAVSAATSAPGLADNNAFADPEILVTGDQTVIEKNEVSKTNTQSIAAKQATPQEFEGSAAPKPNDLSLEVLRRIDNAHATQSIIKPARPVNRGKSTDEEVRARGLEKLTLSPSSEPHIGWETRDFKWPQVVCQIGNTATETAGGLVEAIEKTLKPSQKRLAIVGSGRGPGTTTIASYLARILASRKKRVLLIDGDLSKPDLSTNLRIPHQLSWLNAVKGNRVASHSIVKSVETGISVMPVQKMATPVTWPRFIYDSLGEIVDAVQSNFDIVLIDIGPVSQIVRELSRPNLLVDAAVFVHNVRVPDQPTFVRNQNELVSFGIKRLVVAENFSQSVV